jgi:hypothetical protein
VENACRIYWPRDPRKTALWGLLDTLYERVKGQWEERFERKHGFWRGLADGAVARYLPHVHALVSRGGWTDSGEWVPVPYVDERAAEELLRHKVLALLRRRGLLRQERIELLRSWRRSGFSVPNRVWAHPAQGREFEALVRYMSRSPVSLKRLRFAPGAKEVVYTRKGRHDAAEPTNDEKIDAEEFVARVLVQIPARASPPSRPRTSGMAQGRVVDPGRHRGLSPRPALTLGPSQGPLTLQRPRQRFSRPS